MVLLVEDDPLTRSLAELSLQEEGFEVIAAADGEEALDAFEERPDIDVVFTDLELPRRGGLSLAREVNRRRPGVETVLASGRLRPTPDEIPDDGTFVEKPYDCRVIAELIREKVGNPQRH